MICAIHQPNFIPWLGYFDKIKRSDVFVLIDDVQYPKKGGSWSNRVYLNFSGHKKFITAPIKRPSGLQAVNEIEFDGNRWRDKHLKTIRTYYAKAGYFEDYFDFIASIYDYQTDNVSDFNYHAVVRLCDLYGIKTPIIKSSSINNKFSSNEMLAYLTAEVGCTTYMAGGGASEYQDINVFSDRGIDFIYQDFQHPKYTQLNSSSFVEGLSIIDYLFNVGAKQWS